MLASFAISPYGLRRELRQQLRIIDNRNPHIPHGHNAVFYHSYSVP